MRFAFVLSLAVVGVGAFMEGSSFPEDEQQRLDTCKPLVACPHHSAPPPPPSSSSSSSSPAPASSSKSSSSESGECICSGSGSGSGLGSGSGMEESSGSGESVESGSGELDGSGSFWLPGEYCFLLEILLEFRFEFSGEIEIAYIEFINSTQMNIVEDIELTEYEILVKIWYGLEALFLEFPEIQEAIFFKPIPNWGVVYQIEGLATDILAEFAELPVEDIVTVDADGSSPLVSALLNCSTSSAAEADALEALIGEIELILNGSVAFDLELVLIYEKLSAFFLEFPQLKAVFFAVEIPGFGPFEGLFDIFLVYWEIENFPLAVGGPVSDCLLIQALTALYENTTDGLSVSERSDLKQLETSVQTFFDTEMDVSLRLDFFAKTLYEFVLLENWTLSVVMEVELPGYGKILDLIYAYSFCKNHGIVPGDFTQMPTTAVSTTESSTEASTTVQTTTSLPTGDCSTVLTVNVFVDNTTHLISSIADAQKSWPKSAATQFTGYLKRIFNISANSTVTPTSKFSQIQTILTGWTPKSSSAYALVQEVMIVAWGPISAYCQCEV